jgi:hypothetical protein
VSLIASALRPPVDRYEIGRPPMSWGSSGTSGDHPACRGGAGRTDPTNGPRPAAHMGLELLNKEPGAAEQVIIVHVSLQRDRSRSPTPGHNFFPPVLPKLSARCEPIGLLLRAATSRPRPPHLGVGRSAVILIAGGLTTILVCPPNTPKCETSICKGNRTSVDVGGPAADVCGSRATSSLSYPSPPR